MNRKKAILLSILAIVFGVAANVASSLAAMGLNKMGVEKGICNGAAGILYLGLAFIFIKLLVEKIFKFKLLEFGITKFSVKIKWVIVAILLPMAVTLVYIAFFSGEYISSGMNKSTIIATLSAGILFTGIAAGFVEEMLFRGIIFHSLQTVWGTKVALLLPSLLFGLVHIIGADFSLGSCILVIIAGTAVGVMFTLITIESGSIWCNAIVHALWNIIVIGGGLSIGEKPSEYSIVTYVLKTKAFAITGGDFGIESSLISVVGYLIVSLIAIIMIRYKLTGISSTY